MSVNAKHACCETESTGATLQFLGMRAGTKTKHTQRMTGTTACFSKQQTVEIIPWEQYWGGGGGGRKEVHRLQEAEIQLEKVGKVSLAESRPVQHSCSRKATSAHGVRYYNPVAEPIKWPSVDSLLIYRHFNSTAHHYLINITELSRIMLL